jgi:pimeloyl-ACP methyl ester carboxylesterase
MRTLKQFHLVGFLLLLTPAAFAQQFPEPAPQQRTISERPATRPAATEPLGIALENYDYPYPVKFLEFTNEGQTVRMGYMDIDPPGSKNGQTVVLMHGKSFAGYYWKQTIDALLNSGYRVVVPDQVGWGKSSKPDMHYTFDLLANNTAKLLDSLKVNKVMVVGHSTGGMLATKFATMFGDRVTKLVLEDPIGLEDYSKFIPAQTPETLYAAEMKPAEESEVRDFYSAYFADPKPSVVNPLAEIPLRVRLSGEYPRWAKAAALTYQMIYEQPVRESFRSIGVPTLIVVGDKDRTIPMGQYVTAEVRQGMGDSPKMANNVAGEMPHGKVVVMKDTGHIPHLEHPAEFNQTVLNFFKDGEPVTKTE